MWLNIQLPFHGCWLAFPCLSFLYFAFLLFCIFLNLYTYYQLKYLKKMSRLLPGNTHLEHFYPGRVLKRLPVEGMSLCSTDNGNAITKVRLSICSYNNWKRSWHTFSDWREKITPFPQHNVNPSNVVRSLVRSPNIDLMGTGKDYDKRENLCFLSNNVLSLLRF